MIVSGVARERLCHHDLVSFPSRMQTGNGTGKRHDHVEKEREDMSMEVERHIEVAGGSIAVRTAGSGRGIVFVHGGGGDGHNWDGIVERLRHRFTCVIVDRCGYGKSTWTAPTPPSRDDHGAHFCQVVEELELEDPCGVGTSGGAIAILAALRRHKEIVTGAVLIEPPLHIDDGDGDGVPVPAPLDSSSATRTDDQGDIVDRGIASIRRLDPVAWDTMVPENRQRYIDSFPTMLRETSQPGIKITRQEIERMDLPVTVVYGTTTPERLIDFSEALSATLPQGRIETIEGAAHLMYLTHTDEVCRLIERFVDTCPRMSRSA